MIYQGFKYLFVRLGVTTFLVMTLGYGVLFFFHEVALPATHMDDTVLQWSLLGASLFFGFITYGMVGEWRFARGLSRLREIDLQTAFSEIQRHFEELYHFTRSSYFWPRTGRRLRQQVIRENAEYLLAIGAEDLKAQRIFLKAFLQDPEDTRFRDILVSALTQKPELSAQEVDVLLLILRAENYEDRPLLNHLVSYFLEQDVFNNKSEPVFRKALEIRSGKEHRITRFMLPVLLAKKRSDARTIDFYLHALPEADPDLKKHLRELIGLCFCENRFAAADPILHERCGKVFSVLDPAEQNRLRDVADERSLPGKWKRVRLLTGEDKRALKDLLKKTGLVKSWGQHLANFAGWCGGRLLALLRGTLLALLEGLKRFGEQPTRSKLLVLGLAGLAMVVGAVVVDWRLSDRIDSSPSALVEEGVDSNDRSNNPATSVQEDRDFTIQVAAVTTQAKADKFLTLLKRNKISGAYVLKVPRKKGGYWYKIRIGRFGSKEKAKAFANRMVQSKLVRNYFLIALRRNST